MAPKCGIYTVIGNGLLYVLNVFAHFLPMLFSRSHKEPKLLAGAVAVIKFQL